MPFLKADPNGGPDLEASFSIKGPGYEITNLNHADYTFPVDGWEYVEVLPTPQPEYDPETQTCVEGVPMKDGEVWMQTWVVSEALPL